MYEVIEHEQETLHKQIRLSHCVQTCSRRDIALILNFLSCVLHVYRMGHCYTLNSLPAFQLLVIFVHSRCVFIHSSIWSCSVKGSPQPKAQQLYVYKWPITVVRPMIMVKAWIFYKHLSAICLLHNVMCVLVYDQSRSFAYMFSKYASASRSLALKAMLFFLQFKFISTHITQNQMMCRYLHFCI